MNRAQAALVLRPPLVIAILVAVARLGGSLAPGVFGSVLAVLFVVSTAGAWTVLRATGDPGEAVVPIPGRARIGLEVLIVGGATLGLWILDAPVFAVGLAALAAVQYGAAIDRVTRLLDLPVGAVPTRDPRA
ncbi:MAG: DUF2568 domain-containing protein [Halobacteriaceae archaeon]